jgi:hypothetical protein
MTAHNRIACPRGIFNKNSLGIIPIKHPENVIPIKGGIPQQAKTNLLKNVRKKNST